MKTKIIIKTSFEGIHSYANAPKEVEFLRCPHRHKFYVELEAVINKDRELEYFQQKQVIDRYISKNISSIISFLSCEAIAKKILQHFRQYDVVRVFEDNENGSEVSR